LYVCGFDDAYFDIAAADGARGCSVTTGNKIAAILAALMFAYLAWPTISGVVSRGIAALSQFFHTSGSDTTKLPAAGSKVTSEQAQAATLLIVRFLGQGDSDPAYKLICGEINTLKTLVPPEQKS
jgi:hypothetical protein